MRFSLRLNNDLELDTYVELARAAERGGFEQLWVSHDLFLQSAPVIVGALARETERLRLGIGVFNPYTMHTAEIAMTAATLQALSRGRFLLGLAAGAREFLRWVGLRQERPLAAVRESLLALRALLRGERYRARGRHLSWEEEGVLAFAPPAPPPIYLGAMGPKMLELAGELADGVLPLLFPPEHRETVEPLLDRGVARRDPALGELDRAACVWVSIARDRERARRVLAEKIATYGPSLGPLILERLGLERADFEPIRRAVAAGDRERAIASVDERMLAIGIVGSPEDVIERLEPLVAAGARHLSFGPPLGPDPVAAVRLLAERVLPYFAAS